MYPKNAASPQRVAIGPVVQISDGAVQTASVSVKVMPQGGVASAGGGTIAYEEGIVHYVPTQAETNYTSFMLIAYKTGCIPATCTVVTTASAVAGYAGLDWSVINAPTTTVGLSGTTVKTATDVETDTVDIQSRLPSSLVGGRIDANVGAISADSVAADNAEAFFDGTGYAGTNNVIPTVTTLTNLPAITPNWLTSAGINAGALDGKGNWNIGKTGYSLTATTGLGNQTADITGTVSTVTTLTNLPAITANWLTAAGINAGALDGKGNWNIGKTGYTLTATTGLGNQTADITGTVSTVTTLTGHTPQTGDSFARIGATGSGLTSLTTELAKVPKSDGTSTWNATALASLQAEVTDALNAYDPPTNAEMEARTPTAAQLAYIVANAATGLPVTFTTSGGSTTAAVLNLVDGAAASATNDQYNGRLLVFTDGTLKGVVTDITDYVGGTTTATITAIPFAPTASHNARLI